MSIRTLARRTAVAATGGALAASGLLAVAPVPSAHAAPAPEAEAAAAWLTAQLDEEGAFSYLNWSGEVATDVGTTIDFGLSLLEAVPESPALDLVTDGIEANLTAYVGSDPADASKADEAAKAAVFFQAREMSTTVGGIDLIDRVATAAGADGALTPTVQAYEQVWAARALSGAGNEFADEALQFLVSDLQCEGGGWGFGRDSSCVADPDTTALAVLALHEAGSPDLADAVTYLEDQQAADGSFANFGNPNTNSTAMAGLALGTVGESAAAARAAAWVADHQVPQSAPCGSRGLDPHVGAIGYDSAAVRDGIRYGIRPGDQSMWTLATAQSLAALQFLQPRPTQVATITGPTGFVRAGSTVSVVVKGVRPGQQACVTGVGATQWIVGSEKVSVTLPAGTANRTVLLRHSGGITSTTVKALGATKLTVKAPARVTAKKKAKIKVTGLAAGERVTVTLGKKSKTVVAQANGTAKVKVKAPKAKGKAKVKVTGQFADRKGKAKVRVV